MLLRRMIQATLEKLNTKKANKIQQNFPKPYWYTKQGGFDKYWYTNWGFIDRVGDLDKICVSSSSGCDETDVISRSSRTFKFEWTGGEWYDRKCTSWINSAWCDFVWNWSGDIDDNSKLQ